MASGERQVVERVSGGIRTPPTSNGIGHPAKRKCLSYGGPENVESWAVSEIETEGPFGFRWDLHHYSAFSGTVEVKSPVFKGGHKSNHSWQLKMCPKKLAGSLEYFAVHLILVDFGDGDDKCPNRKVRARFQISLLDTEGRPVKQAGSPTMNASEFKKLSVWGYDKFILSSELLAPSRRLVNEDTLIVHCRIWIEGQLKHKVGEGGAAKYRVSDEEKEQKRRDRLAFDFGNLFKKSVLTDIEILAVNTTFKVHKAVLAGRSSVFAKMFNTNMVEKETNTLEIKDFDDGAVKGMLEYLYSGETDLKERAPDLLQIAEKYDLGGLKEDCEYVIAENLNVENAAEILVMGSLYNAPLLKSRAIDFINCNRDDVGKTKSFQRIAKLEAHANVFVELYLSQ